MLESGGKTDQMCTWCTCVYSSMLSGLWCAWQTAVLPLRDPRHRWMFPCCTHFSCCTDIQTGRTGSRRWVWVFAHVEYTLVYVFCTQQAAVFIIFDLFVFLSCSWGVWPWREPTFYWRAEPYVSLHCLQLCLPLEFSHTPLYDSQYVVKYQFPFQKMLQSDWQLRFNDAWKKKTCDWFDSHEATTDHFWLWNYTCSFWMAQYNSSHTVL